MDADDSAVILAKRRLRTELLARRRAQSPSARAGAREANTDHLLRHLRGVAAVCCFQPLPTEPLADRLLAELSDTGTRVLIPVVVGPRPLDWLDFSAARRAGVSIDADPWGRGATSGATLGSAAVSDVAVLLVPALAVDRQGFRLGRGGGHYDRTLALLRELNPQRRELIGVLFDDETVPTVPHDGLDEPVTLVVTPAAGVVSIG